MPTHEYEPSTSLLLGPLHERQETHRAQLELPVSSKIMRQRVTIPAGINTAGHSNPFAA